MVVVYILLFIVCLSTLIMVHEFGHLLTAKMFKVYCFEYAIGFGPKLLSFKRKNGETYFSLRAVPFGGFVSMYGESETVPEGLEIDESRSLLKISKWKRAIIMVAGVTMNFILAILVFFVYEIGFPTHQPRYAHISIDQDSIAYNAGLRSKDFLYTAIGEDSNGSLVFYDDNALLTYSDESVANVYVGFKYYSITFKDTSLFNTAIGFETKNNGQLTITDYEEKTVNDVLTQTISSDVNIKLTSYMEGIIAQNDEKKTISYAVVGNYGEEAKEENILVLTATYRNGDERESLLSIPRHGEISIIGNVSSYKENDKTYKSIAIKDYNYSFNSPDYSKGNIFEAKDNGKAPKNISMSIYRTKENEYQGKGKEKIELNNLALTASGATYKLPNNLGLNMQIDQSYNNFGAAITNTFKDFGNASVLIFTSLGQLFTSAKAWEGVGGIIAVGVLTTQTLQQYGFGQFLFMWALISVNLGIVNLLPFPGLDGWQLLVTAIEGVTRKEVPSKVKTIFSLIGISILFVLMAVIIVKDLITFVF